jgi:hypothetical protein
VAEQQPMLRGAEEQVQYDLEVHRRRDLPASHRARKHDAVLGPQRFEHPVPPRRLQFRVVLGRPDQRRQQAPRRRRGHRPHPGAQREQQVIPQ